MAEQRHPELGTGRLLAQSLSRRHLLQRLAAMTAVGAALPLVAACGPASQPATTAAPTQPVAQGKPVGTAAPAAQPTGELKKGGSLKVAILGEPPALDIMFTTATVTRNI